MWGGTSRRGGNRAAPRGKRLWRQHVYLAARHSLRLPHGRQIAGLCGDCDSHAGARHRREHRALFRGERRAAQSAPVPAAGSPGGHLRQEQRVFALFHLLSEFSRLGAQPALFLRYRGLSPGELQPDRHGRPRTRESGNGLRGFLLRTWCEPRCGPPATPRGRPCGRTAGGARQRRILATEIRLFAGRSRKNADPRRRGLHRGGRDSGGFSLSERQFSGERRLCAHRPVERFDLSRPAHWHGHGRGGPAQAGSDAPAGPDRHGQRGARSG